jgi:hypothetical protein
MSAVNTASFLSQTGVRIPDAAEWQKLPRRGVLTEDVKRRVSQQRPHASADDVRLENVAARSHEDLAAASAERRFQSLLATWRADTKMISNEVTVLLHRAHFAIVGMGREALPFIFQDLAAGGGPWFVALQAITLENPIAPENAKSSSRMREDWLKWGRIHDYVSS